MILKTPAGGPPQPLGAAVPDRKFHSSLLQMFITAQSTSAQLMRLQETSILLRPLLSQPSVALSASFSFPDSWL